jgi:hypothetical protein
MECEKVNHAQRFEQQHDVSQVCSLDFRHCRRQHLILVLTMSIQSVRLAAKSKVKVKVEVSGSRQKHTYAHMYMSENNKLSQFRLPT